MLVINYTSVIVFGFDNTVKCNQQIFPLVNENLTSVYVNVCVHILATQRTALTVYGECTDMLAYCQQNPFDCAWLFSMPLSLIITCP